VNIVNSNVSQTHVRAEVFSELRMPISQMDFTKPLILNDQTISGYKNIDQLVSAINASPAGLLASITQDGQLLIENPQGTDIRVGVTPNGNALNVKPSNYSAQIRMVQVVRDMRVGSAELDFNKPLQINGVNLAEASYDFSSLSTPYSVEFGFPAKSVSAPDVQSLAKQLNADSDFAALYAAKVDPTSHKLSITSISGEIPEQDLKNTFAVKANANLVAAQPNVTSLQEFVTRINSKNHESRFGIEHHRPQRHACHFDWAAHCPRWNLRGQCPWDCP
jgi:hypothetical protein